MKLTAAPFLSIFLIILLSCKSVLYLDDDSSIKVPDKKVHVYLLIGQSNMAGRGELFEDDKVVKDNLFYFNKENRWFIAVPPIHDDIDKGTGLGIGMTFGKYMAEQYPKAYIGLVPAAKGGSKVEEWSESKESKFTKSYPYSELVAKVDSLHNKGVVKGIIWHQGEADSRGKEDVENYKQRFFSFLDNLKSDLKLNKDIPVVIGEVGHFLYDQKKYPYAKELNKVLKEIADENENIAIVSAKDMEDRGDHVHFSTNSYRILGYRYARAMCALQKVNYK